MRVKLFLNLGRALAACLLASLTAAAQEQPRVRLSLRVVVFAGAAPTFYPLPDKDKAGSGAVIGNLRKLPSARLMGGLPVDSVTLNFSREMGGARVAVFAHRGSEQARESIKVAEQVVGEGREYAVTQLAAYGVEPLSFSVVRRADVELTPPRVDSRARSVEVAEIKVHPEVPSFALVLRNASDKDLRAVEIEEYRGWMRKGPPPAYDWRFAAPVKPGKTWTVTLEFGWNGKASAEGHTVEPPDSVVIRSALFTDGSYEGDSQFAARAEAFREGRRVQLGRVLELMRELEGWPDGQAATRELMARIQMLECVAEWTAVTEFAGRYGAARGEELDRIKSQMEAGMSSQRGAALGMLNTFITRAPAASDPGAARQWLNALREQYEKSLPSL
ncbi:MAG TPA: hypothetical protein VFZ44_12345 [Pyrinomonadaceae bacterium]